MNSRLRIVLLGYIVRCPVGGMAWSHLMYMLGLTDLGHDVWFLEDGGDSPYACYDPSTFQTGRDPSAGLAFAKDAFDRLGLPERWAYHDALGQAWHGPAGTRMTGILKDADMVINMAGANPMRPWIETVPVRAFVDQDPVFTQVRHLTDAAAMAAARRHTAFFTFGENFGRDGCSIPDDGLAWQPTRHPVPLATWPVQPSVAGGAFTTVMNWQSYPPVEYDGRRFGTKAQTLVDFIDLPRQVPGPFEIAIGGKGFPTERLVEAGWRLRNGAQVSVDPWAYRDYIRASKGEFAVAKEAYVVTASGWFSERSACYLASGRPVVVQDTAMPAAFGAEGGVLTFADPAAAAAAVAAVNGSYQRHAEAARAAAETHFEARRVLASLIERSFASPVVPADGAARGPRRRSGP